MSERLTGAAQAEAERRYGGSGGWDRGVDEADLRSRDAFVAGVLWHEARGGDFTDTPAPSDDEREATPDEAHDIGYVKGHIDGYREAMAEAEAGRQGAVSVSREQIDRAVKGWNGAPFSNPEGRMWMLRRVFASLGIEVSD